MPTAIQNLNHERISVASTEYAVTMQKSCTSTIVYYVADEEGMFGCDRHVLAFTRAYHFRSFFTLDEARNKSLDHGHFLMSIKRPRNRIEVAERTH
jgi:hypothetical protein